MEKKIRINILLPLVGVMVAWLGMVLASVLDLPFDYGSTPEVKASTYTVLAGLTLGSLLCLWAFKRADAAHASGETPLIRAEYRYAGLLIIIAMVFVAIFALATFMNSFNTYSIAGEPTPMGRFLGTYLPILLAAGLEVFLLLQSTLYRKTSAVAESEGKGMSETQKALAIGYALPILGTALAIIIGLIVYDIQGQKLENWSWVIIQLIIGSSIVLGTRSAAKARSAKPVVRAPRVVGAAGAVTLNYVLSLVFAGAVSVMSFGFATDAVTQLKSNDYCDETRDSCVWDFAPMNTDWWFSKMVPAFLLLVLVEVAVYLVITARNKEVKP